MYYFWGWNNFMQKWNLKSFGYMEEYKLRDMWYFVSVDIKDSIKSNWRIDTSHIQKFSTCFYFNILRPNQKHFNRFVCEHVDKVNYLILKSFSLKLKEEIKKTSSSITRFSLSNVWKDRSLLKSTDSFEL